MLSFNPSTWVPALALVFAALGCAPTAQAQPARTGHVTAELVAERSAVQPGQPVQIGLRLQHEPHWHTYWRNPGDSGLPTTVAWSQLPAGSQAGEIEWPAPRRLPIGPLVNYGYEGELLLPLRYTAPAGALPGTTLNLRAQANWLVCKDVCIPESATLDLRLPVVGAGTTPGSTPHAALFARAAAARPAPLQGWTAQVQRAGDEVLLTLEPTGANGGGNAAAIEVFPYPEQVLEPARHEVYRTERGYAVKLAMRKQGSPLPERLSGIAVAPGDPALGAVPAWGGGPRSVEFHAPVHTVAAIALPAGAQKMADAAGAPPATVGGGASLGLLAALGLALVGGMVLNLMPCVFPVLSIKLLSLARQDAGKGGLRIHAAAYAAGVVLSFVALAGVLLLLREAGSSVGWGFQLQEPGVVFVLALLFFVIGLNLMGGFELGHLLPQRLALWRSERPAADAFASGVLAVVAASPCTAPFMGAALGFAITQPAAVGLGVFATLGIGMALPYAALVLLPGWRSRLPRPGAWMLRLRQALAFPMFATVVWLVWVLGQQAGIDCAAVALLALVGVAFLLWLAGLPRARSLTARVVGVAALAGLVAWSWPGGGGSPAPVAGDAAWQPYDEAAIARHVAAGEAVFVDFTAAWCVSCQVNKRVVLDTGETQQAFADAKVVLMRADWTRRDARITEALARLGRNGVPVYVLIRPGREPLLLPEILTARIVRDALAAL